LGAARTNLRARISSPPRRRLRDCKKKAPARYCESRELKAKFKNTQALNSAIASQSQTLEFQTAHLARRFGISPELAATLAECVFHVETRR
jgi:hypothetical protein